MGNLEEGNDIQDNINANLVQENSDERNHLRLRNRRRLLEQQMNQPEGNRVRNPFGIMVNRDLFIPLNAISLEFGKYSQYYNQFRQNPYKENLFIYIRSLIFPNLNFTQVTFYIALINIIYYVFLLSLGMEKKAKNDVLSINRAIIFEYGGFWPHKLRKSGNKYLQLWKIITCNFINSDFSQIYYNFISLITMCSFLEPFFGRVVYTIIFLFSSIFANLTIFLDLTDIN